MLRYAFDKRFGNDRKSGIIVDIPKHSVRVGDSAQHSAVFGEHAPVEIVLK